ncbi:MAG: type II toxin-antitoxin system RelB/DinJ family antitoxin [Moraxellaceae bacterium]|nr:MAG: type II toxin-antitoxin system RelB/DinJ family antitoxin [Moraxellaceae bacterium]
MRRTEVYQVRLDVHEKKQAFAVFKQLGISPAQAIRLFFRQVVVTRSIPFAIEQGQHEPIETPKKATKKLVEASELSHLSDQDVFDQLNELLQDNSNLQDDGKTADEDNLPNSHPADKAL